MGTTKHVIRKVCRLVSEGIRRGGEEDRRESVGEDIGRGQFPQKIHHPHIQLQQRRHPQEVRGGEHLQCQGTGDEIGGERDGQDINVEIRAGVAVLPAQAAVMVYINTLLSSNNASCLIQYHKNNTPCHPNLWLYSLYSSSCTLPRLVHRILFICRLPSSKPPTSTN